MPYADWPNLPAHRQARVEAALAQKRLGPDASTTLPTLRWLGQQSLGIRRTAALKRASSPSLLRLDSRREADGVQDWIAEKKLSET